ncbi:MAG: tetratricopeptide (TPR) repeat protein [Candidatus Marinamargulisbacteria bacterium]|jgi:tetratricopeptide (TPR) repeat protein
MTLAVIIAGILLYHFSLPFLAERHFRDGYNLSQMGRYKYAIEELEAAVALSPWETHYMVQLGKSYEKFSEKQPTTKGKIDYLLRAERLYQRMLILDSQNPWYINRIAIVYNSLIPLTPDKKDALTAGAEVYSRRAAEADLNNPLFQLNLAYFLHRHGKMDESEPYYKRVIEIDDRMLEARYNLADIYNKQKLPEKRLEQYLAIHEANPTFPKIRLAIASTYLQLKDKKSPIPYLEKEVEINPNGLDPLKTLVTLYHQNKDWNKAVPLYKRILTLYPKEAKFHPYYIQALVNTRQIPLAISELQARIKSNPEDAVASKQLKKLKSILSTR